MANFNPQHKAVLDDLLLGHLGVRAGKMFGFPAYYAGKKLCICLYDQGKDYRQHALIRTQLPVVSAQDE